MTRIYHITHMRNLAGILEQGGLHCDRNAQQLKSVQIGHQHIKARRMARVVPLPPNGTLGDYVPFYFAARSPMLYAIHNGAVVGYDGGQEPVVHLVSSAEDVSDSGLEWVFTEGHAEMAFSDFFGDLGDLDKVDWKVMGSRYWFDTNEDPDRKRRRQAEFLVHQFVPWKLVSYIGAYNAKIQKQVCQALKDQAHVPEIGVEPRWYY